MRWIEKANIDGAGSVENQTKIELAVIVTEEDLNVENEKKWNENG